MTTEQKYSIGREHLRKRVELLSRGMAPPLLRGKPMRNFSGKGVGAGPQGKTFHFYPDGYGKANGMISLPIYSQDHNLGKYAIGCELSSEPNFISTENGVNLKSIKVPKFYTEKLENDKFLCEQGTGMVHSYGTLSTSMAFGCRHFEAGEPCRYCEIEPVAVDLLNFNRTPQINTLCAGIKRALEIQKMKTISISSGSFDKPTVVADNYLELTQKIRSFTDTSLHIQVEPLEDLSYYKRLAMNSDSIGIFLEIFNEKKRQEICPGKAKHSFEKYLQNWEAAVEAYGRGNVMTTCILGFDDDFDEILEKIELISSLGVKTSIVYLRCFSEKLKNYTPSFLNHSVDTLLNFQLEAAKIMVNHGVGFTKGGSSGCVGCQGCTIMQESCALVSTSEVS